MVLAAINSHPILNHTDRSTDKGYDEPPRTKQATDAAAADDDDVLIATDYKLTRRCRSVMCRSR